MSAYELGYYFGFYGFIGFILATGVASLFLLTMQKALRLVSPDLRRMEPGRVWLMLIPFFGFAWTFVMVIRIADSLGPEFKRRNITVFEDRPGLGLGLAWAFLELVFLLCFFSWEMEAVVAPLSLIFCILYWAKIAKFNSMLESSQSFVVPQVNMNFPQQYPPNPFQQPYPPQQIYPPHPQQYPMQQPPPVYPPVPQYNPYPAPQQPVVPPPQKEQQPPAQDYQRWMPKSDDPQTQQPPASQDELSRWQPKNDPPRS